jgi:DNA-directed RNA polymerase specialized sigma24 family protein
LQFQQGLATMKRAMRVHRVKRRHRLDRRMRGWIVNTAKKQYWRVAAWYDLEDLVQEGFVCAMICQQRYSHIRSQRHFMALVQTTFINHIHTLAKQRTRQLDVPISSEVAERVRDPAEHLVKLAGGEEGDQVSLTLLGQLPIELKMLLHRLQTDARLIPMLMHKDRTRETTNEWLCRLIGLPETIDLELIFHEHFGESR